ncbi:DMT family transporter [Aliamphritea spongicola]|uniref:DMT family transporter n=1 Tax=Aliamphritea spongicola TaxID=707589 RepID=UPI001FAFA019|nr:DMT family transporter [Aliamphritea spongicola]
MLTAFLYLLTVIIWGTTWIAIKLQLGDVAIEASIIYRFSLAAIVMFSLLQLFRKRQPLTPRDHLFCLLQGACLFCVNFYCFYLATGYVSSGLISVIFSLATVLNAVNNWIWFGKRPTTRVLCGAVLGLLGISILFWPELQQQSDIWTLLPGIALAAAGTYCFSLGNMLSVRHQKQGLKPPTTNAWGMFYGVAILFVISRINGVEFTISYEASYVSALLYLAIPGTVIGFTAYLMLVGRIGPDSAAYATVMFPVVALTISSLYEGYNWSPAAIGGLLLVISGNIIIFSKFRLPAFGFTGLSNASK